MRAQGLAVPAVAAENTGRGIKVAVVDTGVNFQHPHLSMPGRGWLVRRTDGAIEVLQGGYSDQYGHGTCCAALVHLLAPEAEIWAIRVTADRPTTDADRMAEGIELAARQGADLVCMALGTKTRLAHSLNASVVTALAAGTLVIAADPADGDVVLPAGSPGAVAVRHRDGVDVCFEDGLWFAEGRARPAQGHATNFWGPSLAVARVCGGLARWAEGRTVRGVGLLEGFSNFLDMR